MTKELKIALGLITKLDESFPGSQTLIVGGAVRDALLGLDAYDIDLATNIPLSDLINAGYQLKDITKNTDNAQPVSIITFMDIPFEIASFRTDSVGTDRKSNISTIVDTFEEDSKRRDLTINALGLTSNGRVVDFVSGKRDLDDECIRVVGDPDERFAEDATRILRVFRFASKLNFWIDSKSLQAAYRNRHRLLNRNEIAPESIAKELYKAASLNGQAFARYIKLLDENGMLDDILPELTDLKGRKHNPLYHPEGDAFEHTIACLNISRSTNPVTNLAILLHDVGKSVTEGVSENHGFPNYHGHEKAGVPLVEAIFNRLRFNDLTSHDKAAILFCTEQHMKIHNIKSLKSSKVAKLVLSPFWNIIKDVGFADELCRGFETPEWFDAKMKVAEDRVAKIAESDDSLRLTVKKYVDGHKVQEWFPITKENPKLLKPILAETAEYIIEQLENDEKISDFEIKHFIDSYINSYH